MVLQSAINLHNPVVRCDQPSSPVTPCLPEPYLALSVEALSQQMLSARQQRYLEQARSLISQSGAVTTEGHRVGLPLPVDQAYCK